MKNIIWMICSVLFLVAGNSALAQHHYPPVTLKNSEVRYLHSEIVNEDYRLDIQLPADYATSDTTYPVLIAPDADVGFPLVANISEVLTFPIYQIKPPIIVGIGYKNLRDLGDFMAWRVRDLTPTKNTQTDQYWETQINRIFRRSVKVNSGGAEKFYQFIAQELIPFIDDNYRTSEFRAFMGYSYGGLFTLYVLFNHPETFNAYYAGSPSFHYDNRVLFQYESTYAQTHTDLPVRLFMSSGSLEKRAADLKKMAETLRSRNYPGLKLETSVVPGKNHQTAVPESYTEALMFLLGNDK